MVDSRAQPGAGRKLFYGLFIFPLIIAVGMAILLCSVVLLTHEDETPESLIAAIRTGSPSKRWQKAYELSNELNQGRGMIRASGVMKEIVFILTNRTEYDARTRAYMALALSRFNDEDAKAALRQALKDETEEEVQIHLLWALGTVRDSEAVDSILSFLGKESAELRKTAAYVLGVLGQPEKSVPPLRGGKDSHVYTAVGGAVIPALGALLHDQTQDVRWNAALSLARLGSDTGYGELLNMTDRSSLNAVAAVDEARAEEIIVTAVKGLAMLAKPESRSILESLAKNDVSLKVRQAALDALKTVDSK